MPADSRPEQRVKSTGSDDSLAWAHTVVFEAARSLGVPAEAVEVDPRAAGETAHAEGERVVVSADLARHPGLLRFVLAHEFAHQRLGHTRGSVLHDPSSQTQMQQEFDADALAVSWVCGAGDCDVEPFARMLERTPEGPRHPPGVERAARVRQAARAFETGAPALPSGGFFAREPAPDSFAVQARSR